MHMVLDTTGLPQEEAFEYWMDVACARFSTSRAWTPLDRAHFFAVLRAGTLTDLELTDWRIAPIAGRSGTRDDLLMLFLRAHCSFLTNESCIELNGGNVYLLDSHAPYTWRTPEPFETMAVKIPRNALARRLNGAVAKVVNRPVPLNGVAALLNAQVRALIDAGPSTLDTACAAAVREHLLDLTSFVFAPFAGKAPKLGASGHMVAVKLRTAVEVQLHNPDTNRASICAAAGVSERHANRILAQEGTSVTQLLQERRLERCRVALERSDRPVSEIALSCGYGDLRHFARVFRARYGVTPSAIRHSGT